MYKNHLKNCLVFRFFYFINRCNVICWYLFKVINGHRPANLDYRNKSGNDSREESIAFNKFFEYPSPADKSATSPSRGEVTRLLRFARNDIHCLGRSMIEMLGVLAIIAILSVGGIAGYSKAMREWKSNIQRNMITELIHAMIEIKPKLGKNLEIFQNITYVVDSLGYMPEGVTFVDNSIYDKEGNRIEIHKYNGENKYYVMEIFFQTTENSLLSLDSEEFCRNIVLATQPVAEEIVQINFWESNKSGDGEIHGPIIFRHNNLAQASLADIQQKCKITSKFSGEAHYTISLIP